MADLGVLQPELLVGGLVCAGAGAALSAVRPLRTQVAAADLAAVLVAILLVVDRQVPPSLLAGAAVLAGRRAAPPRWRLPAAVVGGALVVLARPGWSPSARLLVALALVVLVVADRADAPGPRWTTAALSTVALAATFVGGPDTEVTVAVAAATLPTLVVARWRPGPPSLAALSVAAWAAAEAYRGRPAGLPAAAVALAALTATAIVAPWWRARWTRWSAWPAPLPAAVTVAVAGLAALGAARTFGLAGDLQPSAAVAATVLVAVVAGTASLSEPGPGAARRRPG